MLSLNMKAFRNEDTARFKLICSHSQTSCNYVSQNSPRSWTGCIFHL